LEEGGRAHFMTKRFDRVGNRKLHVQSLCAMAHLDFNVPYVHSYEQYMRTILQLKLGAAAIEQAWLRCAFNVAFVNCDDHTKNLAFLMGPDGAWSLAPAFDMCFAHNPAVDRWTRQHQMLVNGKAWDITRDDVLTLGTSFGVNQPRILLERVLEARAQWPTIAADVRVPKSRVKEITARQPNLGAVSRSPAMKRIPGEAKTVRKKTAAGEKTAAKKTPTKKVKGKRRSF
jgi:serine/threonine-protein kinase HipA